MIILISGNSCTGKTLMSQKLLEKYHIPYLSIDHIKMGMYRADAGCGFTPLDSTEHIGEKLWPIIKGIIMTNIENSQNIIIEGCYILPHYIKDFEAAYSEKIISVFIGFSQNYIEKNFTSNIVKHRNAIEDRGYPEEGIIDDYIDEHDAFRRKCLANDVDYFEIDKNYEEEITKVYDFIETQKREIDRKFKSFNARMV
ncbi:2-phosphoglycerate kinase [Paenibacillus hemerocallicola]|uniref:2-phosphoglycerate kinase n=1 Tax=Paenibacillus hemerocallicola TaxID=1172614 RepID=A0A5C4THG1_9BACL|nr:2-phosphoglycerate kinase [Paenibacillus hemerocallicola]TNJ68096.1 2-phosphoglycerate kinase [Paenibacillus hemerocallicola]